MLQSFKSIIKKFPVGFTKMIETGFSVNKGLPASSAPASAKAGTSALLTPGIYMPGNFLKVPSGVAVLQIIKSHISDIAEMPVICHIKITGIHSAVGFNDKLTPALPRHVACFRIVSHQHHNQIVKIAYAYPLSLNYVFIPQIEGCFQKAGVGFGSKRKLTASMGFSQGIKAWYELKKFKIVFLKESVYFSYMPCGVVVYYAKNIIFNTVFIKEADGIHHFFE